jgi:hypothetical protein
MTLCCSGDFTGANQHSGLGHRVADRFGVGHVVLLAFDVRLNLARRDQTRLMTQAAQLASPMERRAASLDADETRRFLGEISLHPRSRQAPADYNPIVRIYSVLLKHRLRDIQPYRNILIHGSPPALTGDRNCCRGWSPVHRIEGGQLELDLARSRPS